MRLPAKARKYLIKTISMQQTAGIQRLGFSDCNKWLPNLSSQERAELDVMGHVESDIRLGNFSQSKVVDVWRTSGVQTRFTGLTSVLEAM